MTNEQKTIWLKVFLVHVERGSTVGAALTAADSAARGYGERFPEPQPETPSLIITRPKEN